MKNKNTYQENINWKFIAGLKAALMLSFFAISFTVYAQSSVLNTRVSLPKQTSTVYSLLNQISRQTGYFFIYDSQVIDNNRRVRIRRSRLEMNELLDEILRDPDLRYKVVHNHILIYRPQEQPAVVQKVEETTPPDPWFTISGRVSDQTTGRPLAFANVGLPEKGLGIATNNEGFFKLRLPVELIDENLRVSFMGYKTQELPVVLLKETPLDILLETDLISMQEVIIRYFDPRAIVIESLSQIENNHSRQPAYFICFYREGVQRNNKYLNYSEAIFRVYKTPYTAIHEEDQVMMLKARNITDVYNTDTLVVKLKAGVQSSLELDIIKHPPDFLDLSSIEKYNFFAAGILSSDNRNVYVVEFRQKEKLTEPLFQGVLYIDTETKALVEAEFEINPKYINKARQRFFTGRLQGYSASIERAWYTISFQQYQGQQHLSHVRGEIKMKFRRRNQLFSNSYSVFLEMAVAHIDLHEVQRFRRREVLKTNTTFVDQGYSYDESFWGEYNIITPETSISEWLSRMQPKIESFY